MTELNFRLENLEFEGPLDLMLLLIQKHKLNIQDIEITVLLDQFLLYLERMTEADIDVTAEFLDAAARLVLIKSAALLPRDEAEKMKKELQGALIEYALCKTMAEKLKKRWIGDAVYVRQPMEIEVDAAYHGTHQPEEIPFAYSAVSKRAKMKSETPRSLAPIVAKSYVTVYTGVVIVLKSLLTKQKVTLAEIYKGRPRSYRVSIFLAVLELSKAGRIVISEDGESVSLREENAPRTDKRQVLL
ncbi:MAG: segregation/condensation protein A [[Eubacterium] saphenum]|nr:segregation/condensation protein A [[Eubacterium] saphenum]